MNPSRSTPADNGQQIFAQHLVARLQEGESALPHEVTERLRAARTRAVHHRKMEFAPLKSQRSAMAGGQTVASGGQLTGYWARLVGWLPLAGLVIGLVLIQSAQNDQRAHELAEIDAALLTDDLPPAAYTDPGFALFMKTHPHQNP